MYREVFSCPNCGYLFRFCTSCGYPFLFNEENDNPISLQKSLLICSSCKEIIKFCPRCGYNFISKEIKQEKIENNELKESFNIFKKEFETFKRNILQEIFNLNERILNIELIELEKAERLKKLSQRKTKESITM